MNFTSRKFLSISLVAISISFGTCVLWAAKDPFIGDWKLNPSRSKLTDVMKVENLGDNKYIFNFGSGPETIVLDGTDQSGHYGTTLSVGIEDGTWQVIRKRDGRVQISAVWSLSENGSTLTDHFTGFNANGSSYNLNYVYKRKGAGSHPTMGCQRLRSSATRKRREMALTAATIVVIGRKAAAVIHESAP